MRCCSAPGCASTDVRARGHSFYCPMHLRFGQMIDTARRHGKYIPTRAELSAMVPADLRCPCCARAMLWHTDRQGVHPDLVTLQHWRSGALSFICFSCNARHAGLPSDEVFLQTPPGHKWCNRCRTYKPFGRFKWRSGGRSQLRSTCRDCDAAAFRLSSNRNGKSKALRATVARLMLATNKGAPCSV